MKSATLPSFWSAYELLPKNIKREAKKAFLLWSENPFHPSLHFKCVNKDENVWSLRITRGYRAVGNLKDNTVTWYWIGTHDEYEKLIAQL